MNIGLVTCHHIPDLVKSERLLIPIFHQSGNQARPVIWNDTSVQWKDFDLLIIRSIWDYHLHPETFLKWLGLLKKHKIKVLNSIEIVSENHHKFYLRKLQNAGVEIVPTHFLEKTDDLDLSILYHKAWQKFVIKPAVSASAYQTEIFTINDVDKIQDQYRDMASKRDFLVQRFMPEIQSFGELSIIFINRKYSHTVLKTARANEFRVQSEYGGHSEKYSPSTYLIQTASMILDQYPGDMLYARVDGIVKDEKFVLMELELIEPLLFLDDQEGAHEKFVVSALELARSSSG